MAAEPALDLRRPLRIHIVGIGGAGMSAIATVLVAMGHRVSGSDLQATASLERLRAAGVDARVGHAAENLGRVDAVAISSAVPDDNPEVVAARERGVPVLRRAHVLKAICSVRRTAAVAGTHGKTTTASMLALVLVEAGMRPSYIVGGDLNETGTGAVWDSGDWFVVEADESDGTFVEVGAEAALVNNIEPDHLEHWGGFDPLVEAFRRFLAEAPGPRVASADDPIAAELAARSGAVTFGTSPAADYRIVDLERGRSGTRFRVIHDGDTIADVVLPVPGTHNARNATAALVTAVLIGADPSAATRALSRYAGVARRYQFRGEVEGVAFVDSYDHLATEVAAALEAARDGHWDRVVCVFQPHRYSRTETLWRTFADAFEGADVLVVTDVYSAGEPARPGVTGKLVVDAVLGAHPWRRVAYLPKRGELVRFLTAELRPGDLCLTLGAGDLTTLPDELLPAIRSRSDTGLARR